MPGGGSYLETARLAVTIRELPRQSDFSKPPFFNGGLPFIVWNPACCRVSWRIQMIKVPLTVLGAEQLKAELQRLKSIERPSVIAAIAEARSHGDLSENAEYDAAKERQGFVEGRIAEIESKLSNAQIIDPTTLDADGRIVFGATVKLLDMESDDEVCYQIVGDDEADIKQGKVSVNSPIARALIGKESGDVAEVQAPGGLREYEVLDVEYR
jgi:transcription elongation factor GreA